MIYQSDTGARFIILSEFEDWEDLKIATSVAKRSIQKQVVAHLRLPKNLDFPTLLSQLEKLQENVEFIGIQASWEQADLPDLMASLVEHFGIVSLLLDEPAPLSFGRVSSEFTKTIQQLLPLEPAIIGGGRYTTPAHIQAISQRIKTLYEN